MLIRHRVGLVKAIVEEYGLIIDIRLVASAENKSDSLTRVSHKWLKLLEDAGNGEETGCIGATPPIDSSISNIHAGIVHQAMSVDENTGANMIQTGDAVWIKPNGAHCETSYKARKV